MLRIFIPLLDALDDEKKRRQEFYDVLHWGTLTNQNLKNEIKRTAKLLYQRD